MFTIITTQSILEKILTGEESLWQSILHNSQNIQIILKSDGDWRSSPDNPLFILSQSLGMNFPDKNEYISNIEIYPESVMEYPSGIFILDIPIETANEIQKDYGVIVQSGHNIDSRILTKPFEKDRYSFDDNEKGGWEQILACLKEYPSNAMVINDRNLFTNKSKSKNGSWSNDGIENVINILDQILPKTFKTKYQVCIICGDSKQIKNDFSKISTLLNKRKKELNRNYEIELELVAINSVYGDLFRITHNRRICSNYFLITADHKIAAFINDESTCSQAIFIHKLFDSSSFGAKELSKNISGYTKIIARCMTDINYEHYYSCNGNCHASVNNFKNRLLKSPYVHQ